MSRRLSTITERRRALIAEAAQQRTALAMALLPWKRPAELADHAISIVSVLRRHPVWLLAATVAVSALPQSRAGNLLRRGWFAGQILYSAFSRLRASPEPFVRQRTDRDR